MKNKAIVVGSGIVGLATARSLAVRGWEVTVFDRSPEPVGASVRNFGMVWPVGQPTGPLLERALLSRSLWIELLSAAGAWFEETGSLLVLRQPEELRVAEDFVARNRNFRSCALLTPKEALQKAPALKAEGLLGAIWSPTEVIVDPRQAVPALMTWLQEKVLVQFRLGQAVTEVGSGYVKTGGNRMEADLVVVCSGQDFETLFPEEFRKASITRCKLQMLRTEPQPAGWRLGTALCAGLTLTHYASYADCDGLAELKKYYQEHVPDYVRWGIHVMASQMGSGELTLGDSHEYGPGPDPFDKQFINQLILNYLYAFCDFPKRDIRETWHGIYAKMTDGRTEYVSEPEPGVWIINGLGGAGMTLSLGLTEEWAGAL